jgi:hypothetical protein
MTVARTLLLRTFILVLVLGAPGLTGCAEIHPDNTPHSPMGNRR